MGQLGQKLTSSSSSVLIVIRHHLNHKELCFVLRSPFAFARFVIVLLEYLSSLGAQARIPAAIRT